MCQKVNFTIKKNEITESINLVAYAWGLKNLKKEDTVLITEMEHHSNIIPWQLINQKTGSTLDYIPLNKDGTLNIDSLSAELLSNTKLISISHQSNVFGTINPIKKILNIAKDIGAITLVDGAQSVPHSKVDITDLDCDFYVFSGHKMYGPTGLGVLYAKKKWLEELPWQGGGDMILSVSFEKTQYNVLPYKFEAGTPNIAGTIGLGAAIDYMNSVGIEAYRCYFWGFAEVVLSKNKDITIPYENRNQILLDLIQYYKLQHHELKNMTSHLIIESLRTLQKIAVCRFNDPGDIIIS